MPAELFTKAGVSKLTKLAQAFDKHISNFHRARLSGKLKCFKIGAEWYVRREDWDAYVDRCNGGPRAADDRGTPARTETQRKRDDAKAAVLCESLGV